MGAYGIAAELAGSAINTAVGTFLQDDARFKNYMYGEWAAQNADKRTRALYKDIYSPKALLDQYNEAGLSPALMFGGTPGQGGTSGAMGHGSGALGAMYAPVSALEAAQIDLIKAQADNTKADTGLKEVQRLGQIYENTYKSLFGERYRNESKVMSLYYEDENGENKSLYDIALNCKTYKDFVNFVDNIDWGDNKESVTSAIKSESGQEVMRKVWKSAKIMDDEIAIVQGEANLKGTESEIAEERKKIEAANAKIAQALVNSGFAEKNAQAQISQLEQLIEESKFNATIKGAWNRIISSMKDGTTKDILIILALIFGQAMSKAMPTFNFNGKM